MENIALLRKGSRVYQEYGIVSGQEKDTFTVRTGSGSYPARKSVSCLVEPAARDKVLVCFRETGSAYILAVLERQAGRCCELSVEGDIRLLSRSGSLHLEASDGLELKSMEAISMSSEGLNARFRRASVVIDVLSFAGGLVHNAVQSIKTVATLCESFFDRVHIHAGNSFRTIEETETVKAGSIHQVARKLMTLRARFAVLSAKKDVKIDGKHIHMG